MEFLVRNAEGNVTMRDREYAAEKLGKLERFFHQAQKVEMVHREEKSGHRLEITVFADGFTIRGEDTEPTLREAIDRVCDKLEARLKRLKGRLVKSHRKKGFAPPAGLESDQEAENDGFIEIRERKTFLLKPMSPEEAALQMEMVGHPFFVFKNELSSQIEVLYKRRDGQYGILQPEI